MVHFDRQRCSRSLRWSTQRSIHLKRWTTPYSNHVRSIFTFSSVLLTSTAMLSSLLSDTISLFLPLSIAKIHHVRHVVLVSSILASWRSRISPIFTRGQFWPSGIVVACVCLCVCPCVCVNPQLVRAITHHPFKLGSPNLDHRCKRPWLRSLVFWGVIDLDLQGQI